MKLQKLPKTPAQAGFTLIEILIVLGILGGLMAFVISGVTKSGEQAKRQESAVRATSIQQSLIKYSVDVGKMPESSAGISALWTNPGVPRWSGPYLDEKEANDGWGNQFSYELSAKGPKLISKGADGEEGTADDLVFVNGQQVDGEAPAK